MFLGSNDSRINPHMRAKFDWLQSDGRVEGGGGGGEVAGRGYRHTHVHTKGHYSFI